MKPCEILDNKKEISIFLLICVLIFSINSLFIYNNYMKFKEKKYQYIEAKIENSYEKSRENGKVYRVLKLKHDDFTFYTTAKKDLNLTAPNMVKIGVITENVSFLDYFKKRFYMPNYKICPTKYDKNFKDKMIEFITNQHENIMMKELYSTLYFATNISKNLRDNVTNWGIAHIIAISGFHIGIIFSFSFLIILPVYKFLQNRYFPYRNSTFDITIFVLFCLTIYLFILDFTPSFLRSLAMSFVGFYFLARNLQIVNFKTLFITIIFLISLFPSLIFSIGFYFSCMGVLFIFIYLKHFWSKFSLIKNIMFFNLYIFLAMNIIVYRFFPTITFQQLSVIPLGYIFVIFYPLSIVLHLLNLGYIFDDYLIKFLNFSIENYKTAIPLWLFLLANLLSLLAIRWKIFAIVVPILGFAPILFI